MRTDFYSTIHKAIRGMLYATAEKLGRADFEDEGQACEALQATREMMAFLREHQDHEDLLAMPVILAADPELAARLASQHAAGEELARAVDLLIARIDGATAEERQPLGAQLGRKLALFVAHHLEHMELEETAGHQALWASCSDAEIDAITRRIHQAIGPERMGDWAAWIVPTLSASQRRAMGVQAA